MYLPFIAHSQSSGTYLDNPVFQRLNDDDGLSQGTINAIAQDEKGFIWIGTNDGLNRYDGYEFIVFKNDLNDSTTITSNSITDILIDENGIFWIGTDKGLNKFNPATGRFNFVKNTLEDHNTSITSLAFDKDKQLWIGTRNSGLIRLNTSTYEFEVYYAEPSNQESLPSNSILKLYNDSKNRLWAGFQNGDICYFNTILKSFITIKDYYFTPNEKTLNQVTGFIEDEKNNLWISTFGNSLLYLNTRTMKLSQANRTLTPGNDIPYVLTSVEISGDSLLWLGSDMNGLVLFNLNSETIIYFSAGKGKSNISYRTVKSLFFDKDKNLWIGTNGKGLNILSPYTINFSTISQSTPNDMTLKFSSVRSILEENDSILWVGGYSGLQKFNLHQNKTEEFYDIIPYTLCIDKKNSNLLWIGTEGSGIYILNKKSKNLSHLPSWYQLDSTKGISFIFEAMIIYKIVNLDEKKMLIGTNMGLHVLNKETLNYDFYNHFNTGQPLILEEKVNTIFIDSKKRVLIGTMTGGFAQYHPDMDSITLIDLNNQTNFSLNIDRINCIFEDSKNNFWLGTGSGLVSLDESMNIIGRYSEANGLPNNMVYGILEDISGHLWLSTNMGISQFDMDTHKVNSFNKNDGLPSNEFNSSAYFKGNNNRFYFGGVDGVLYFNPQNIVTKTVPYQAVICEAIIVDKKSKSDFTLPYIDRITLQPDQDILRIKFSSLQYDGLKKSNFAFRFNTNDDNWVNLGTERNITLSLQDPGQYILEIIADNGNGVWTSNPAKISINVLPEYNQTTWFMAFLIISIGALIFLFYLYRVNMIKGHQIKLEKLVNQRTKELKYANKELESANAAKNKFFSIIAHDLKSPFNSMIGFSNILVDDWKNLDEKEKLEIINMVKSTTEDTYQLLVNLLEWSRVQEKHLEYMPNQINLSDLVKASAKQINADAFLKNIRISIGINPKLEIFADTNMLNTVLRNLISNAIKFTPKNGWITIKATEHKHEVECCVIDSGIGMTKEESEKLFKLQYRDSSIGTEGETGTGLGLVLSHEFVKKHKGTFTVLSEPGKGSSFCFTIPKQQLW